MQRIAVDLEPIPPMDFYRSTAVGQALTMALNDLLMKNEIPSVEAFEIRVSQYHPFADELNLFLLIDHLIQ